MRRHGARQRRPARPCSRRAARRSPTGPARAGRTGAACPAVKIVWISGCAPSQASTSAFHWPHAWSNGGPAPVVAVESMQQRPGDVEHAPAAPLGRAPPAPSASAGRGCRRSARPVAVARSAGAPNAHSVAAGVSLRFVHGKFGSSSASSGVGVTTAREARVGAAVLRVAGGGAEAARPGAGARGEQRRERDGRGQRERSAARPGAAAPGRCDAARSRAAAPRGHVAPHASAATRYCFGLIPRTRLNAVLSANGLP